MIFPRKRKLYAVIVADIFLLAVCIVAFFYLKNSFLKSKPPLPGRSLNEEEILSTMRTCVESQDRYGCYQRLAQDAVQRNQIKYVLKVFDDNDSKPYVFSFCHSTTHFIGREAYSKYKSVSKAFEQGSFSCHGGYYHGVLEGYLKNYLDSEQKSEDYLKQKIFEACGRQSDYSTPLLYSECLHGIGHGVMFVTDGELPESLQLCDSLNDTLANTCYGGVFMENSTSNTTHYLSKYLKTDDPMYPCDILGDRYLDQCYRYQSAYFGMLTKKDLPKMINLCYQVPVKYHYQCFLNIGTGEVGYVRDPKDMKAACDLISDKQNKDYCVEGVITELSARYVNEPSYMIDFCKVVDLDNKKTCYSQIGIHIRGWTIDKNKLSAICHQIADKQGEGFCVENAI